MIRSSVRRRGLSTTTPVMIYAIAAIIMLSMHGTSSYPIAASPVVVDNDKDEPKYDELLKSYSAHSINAGQYVPCDPGQKPMMCCCATTPYRSTDKDIAEIVGDYFSTPAYQIAMLIIAVFVLIVPYTRIAMKCYRRLKLTRSEP